MQADLADQVADAALAMFGLADGCRWRRGLLSALRLLLGHGVDSRGRNDAAFPLAAAAAMVAAR